MTYLRRRRSRRDEHGNALTYLGAFGVFLATLVGLFALALSYVAAAHQAQAAADLAALAGASAQSTGHDACAAATRVARDNHAELVACHAAQEAVEVDVRVGVRQPVPGLPTSATRHAIATPVSP